MRKQWKAAAIIVAVAGVSAAMWVIGRNGLESAARCAQEKAAKALGLPVERTIDIGGCGVDMVFVLVPAGDFVMGSPADERGRAAGEGPQRRVRI